MYIGYIYQTTNLINQRVYIGKKHSSEFDSSYYGSGTVLHEAVKKYGKENFDIKVLHWAKTIEELNQKEIEFITLYSNRKLYNIAKGGTGGDTTSNHPDKQTIVNKRAEGLRAWYNSLTSEQKIKHNESISKSKKGKTPNRTNYRHSGETIDKIKKSNKIAAEHRSDTWKINHAKAAEKRRGVTNTHSQTPVLVNGIIYQGVIEAAITLKVSRQTINNWIKKGKAQYVR